MSICQEEERKKGAHGGGLGGLQLTLHAVGTLRTTLSSKQPNQNPCRRRDSIDLHHTPYMSFPWMTNTQIQQSTGLTAYKDHTPHMRSQPTKPTSRCGIHDARGSKRWDEWNRQKSGGMSKIEGGSAFTMAAPTSTAESRLLPAGRNKLLPVGNDSVKVSKHD